MTIDQLQRAHLLLFAHREASASGSIDAMKAVCYIVRNRVRAGWHDGSWIDVIENADDVAGNEPAARATLDVYSRTFQMLMQSVDDIYYSSASDPVEAAVDEALYYQFADRPMRTWFTENILRHPQQHARRAHIGTLVLFN
jgi:hypothetical protein